jgi:hypothetical protein
MERFFFWDWQTLCTSLNNLLLELEFRTICAREIKRLEGSRYQEISVTPPEDHHSHCVRGFAPESVAHIFIYRNSLCTLFSIISQFFTVVTKLAIVQHKPVKILGTKGKCQVSSVHTIERGCFVTVFNCMRPTGHFIPLLLVFPRNMKPELMNGIPPGSVCMYHPSGWIESKIFTWRFLRFIKHTELTN